MSDDVVPNYLMNCREKVELVFISKINEGQETC